MWKYIKIMLRNFVQRAINRNPEPDVAAPDMALDLAIESTIELSFKQRTNVSTPFRNGDVYAYPVIGSGNTKISYGVNGGRYGFCTLQGLRDMVTGKDERWETGNPQ